MKPDLKIVPSPRGRPPTDGLRDRILAVAERVFTEHDFHEVRMDDVAQACGVAKGTLYLYFPGKRELYLAVLFEGMERLRDALDLVAKAPGRPLDRLNRMVVCLLEHVARRRPLFVLLLRREQRLEPRETRMWLRRRERLSRVVQSAIRRAIAAGELRSIDPRVGEEMLLGLVRGFAFGRGDSHSRTREAERVMDLFLRGAGPVRGRTLARRTV